MEWGVYSRIIRRFVRGAFHKFHLFMIRFVQSGAVEMEYIQFLFCYHDYPSYFIPSRKGAVKCCWAADSRFEHIASTVRHTSSQQQILRRKRIIPNILNTGTYWIPTRLQFECTCLADYRIRCINEYEVPGDPRRWCISCFPGCIPACLTLTPTGHTVSPKRTLHAGQDYSPLVCKRSRSACPWQQSRITAMYPFTTFRRPHSWSWLPPWCVLPWYEQKDPCRYTLAMTEALLWSCLRQFSAVSFANFMPNEGWVFWLCQCECSSELHCWRSGR